VLLSPSGITRLVERLATKGLIVRNADPADGRVVLATLSDRGLVLIRSAARTHVHGIREHFTSRLADDDLDAVAIALERIVGPHVPH
jgi:DNA-binding MarR family transcriptional regulator